MVRGLYRSLPATQGISIAVTPYTVSLVLIREDSGLQRPVYYVSKSLHEVEIRYSPLEKAILAVVHASRKLPHYFQAYMVVVLTQLPLKSVLQTADYTGRIALWNTILGAFDIKYMPQISIKGQVLADLVTEFAEPPVEILTKQRSQEGKSVGVVSTPKPPCWKVYVDCAANQKGSGVGLILISPERATIKKSLRLGFSATNNEADYKALLQGVAMVQKMGGKVVEMFSDSRLVVGQVKGEMDSTRSNAYGQVSTYSACHTSPEVATPTQIHWPHLPPPWQENSLELSLSSI